MVPHAAPQRRRHLGLRLSLRRAWWGEGEAWWGGSVQGKVPHERAESSGVGLYCCPAPAEPPCAQCTALPQREGGRDKQPPPPPPHLSRGGLAGALGAGPLLAPLRAGPQAPAALLRPDLQRKARAGRVGCSAWVQSLVWSITAHASTTPPSVTHPRTLNNIPPALLSSPTPSPSPTPTHPRHPSHLLQQRVVESLDEVGVAHVPPQVLALLVPNVSQGTHARLRAGQRRKHEAQAVRQRVLQPPEQRSGVGRRTPAALGGS